MSADESNNAIHGSDANHDSQHYSRRLSNDGPEVEPRTEEEYAAEQLTLRAIVSSKEAGVIIGKAGKNVADLRDETGVRAGVSKVVPGVHDRVLTVTGSLGGISKAYRMVAKGLLEGVPQMGMGGVINNNGTHGMSSLDLLLSSYIVANFSRCSTSHLSQSDGNHYWPTRLEDQADSRLFWCSHGCPERNASPIHGAYRRTPRYSRRY